MGKITAVLFTILFLSSMGSALSATLQYNETDLLNLKPSARDLDADKLSYYFQPPLSSDGTWQTKYGDAGTYYTKVVVSDGKLTSEKNITLVIQKKEELPEIIVKAPTESSLSIIEGESIFFNAYATDKNKDDVKLRWLVDSAERATGSYFTYNPDFYSQGTHAIRIEASDGVLNASKAWNVTVQDFDRKKLLDGFNNLTVKEGNILELRLPDFTKYGLKHEISAPFSNLTRWETGYESAGKYDVTISIWDDSKFKASKSFQINVENVDRPPLAQSKNQYTVQEGDEIKVVLDYVDPDGDPVNIAVGNLPSGANYSNGTIRWKPDYSVVERINIIDEIAWFYHLLGRDFAVQINASSNQSLLTENVNIKVMNTNRQPKILTIPPVTVSEGEAVYFNISATDPDNDTLSYYFDGPITSNGQRALSPGNFYVTVSASDGFLSDKKMVQVTIISSNSLPEISNLGSYSVNEGEMLEIPIKASDREGKLTYSANPKPQGSFFKGNSLFWTPGFDTVLGTESEKQVEIAISASDGKSSANSTARIKVMNVNRPVAILGSSLIDSETFNVNEDIQFYVEAYDPDNDKLTYIWKTSLFKKTEAGSQITARYDSSGKKKISVTVSDGESSDIMEWEIYIMRKPEISLAILR
ncbi:hypothetical protein J4401_07200 [Candidatus Woesearchaeota archaeon]|nr:hypothetical protein [Candidatus Woesearchaeota archaeon]